MRGPTLGALIGTLTTFGLLSLACEKRMGATEAPPVASSSPSVVEPVKVPPAAIGTPLAAFADAAVAPPGEGTPYDQAVAYESGGQIWLARLVLEKHALSDAAVTRDTELLARLCAGQSDEECLAKCEAKLGRKVSRDAGARRPSAVPSARAAEEETDAARAQRLVVKGDYEGARQLLQPKLVAKSISGDELRLLRTACERQHDTMCVLACDGYKKK